MPIGCGSTWEIDSGTSNDQLSAGCPLDVVPHGRLIAALSNNQLSAGCPLDVVPHGRLIAALSNDQLSAGCPLDVVPPHISIMWGE